MTTSPSEQLYEILRHVRPLHQWSAKSVAETVAERGMTVAMRAVIEQVHEAGPQPVPQIARSLWLARQAVQRVVDEAVDQGLLWLGANPAHRRSRLVELTDDGRRAFQEVHRNELEVLAEVAAELDPADIDAAVRVVGTLTRAVRENAEQAEPGRGWSVSGPRPGEEVR